MGMAGGQRDNKRLRSRAGPLKTLLARKQLKHHTDGRGPPTRLCRKTRRARPTRPCRAEATLAAVPLLVGGLQGPLAVSAPCKALGWEPVLHDELRRSFISFCPAPFPSETLELWWRRLSQDVVWGRPKVRAGLLPRSAAWLTLPGCTCEYIYGGTRWPGDPMAPWFMEITDEVCRACGLNDRPNACNANYYADGAQAVGWHADDEPLFAAKKNDALIISLSLGAARTFEVRPNGGGPSQVRLRLGDGDLCTMEGLTQKHFRHRVPREPRRAGARINLTWRWIVKHDKNCGKAAHNLSRERALDEQDSLPTLSVAPLKSHLAEQGAASMESCEGSAKQKLQCSAPRALHRASEAAAKTPAAVGAAAIAAPTTKVDLRGTATPSCARAAVGDAHLPRRVLHEERMERFSASGVRLCLRRCFIDPAACMCPPV